MAITRQWRISNQLESNLKPLRVGVVEDFSGKTVGRITVQEGDGIDQANQAMVETGRYVCDSQASRAAEMEADRGGGVPSERAEIQVRSDRGTGAGELVKFGQPVWYRFSFKIPGDLPQDVPAAGRQLCRTVIHQIKQDWDMPEIAATRFSKKRQLLNFSLGRQSSDRDFTQSHSPRQPGRLEIRRYQVI